MRSGSGSAPRSNDPYGMSTYPPQPQQPYYPNNNQYPSKMYDNRSHSPYQKQPYQNQPYNPNPRNQYPQQGGYYPHGQSQSQGYSNYNPRQGGYQQQPNRQYNQPQSHQYNNYDYRNPQPSYPSSTASQYPSNQQSYNTGGYSEE